MGTARDEGDRRRGPGSEAETEEQLFGPALADENARDEAGRQEAAEDAEMAAAEQGMLEEAEEQRIRKAKGKARYAQRVQSENAKRRRLSQGEDDESMKDEGTLSAKVGQEAEALAEDEGAAAGMNAAVNKEASEAEKKDKAKAEEGKYK